VPEVLFDDPLLRLTLDRDAGIARYERTARAYPSIDDVGRVHDALVAVVLGQPRGAYTILVDLRLAPPRNDEAYEATIEGYMDLLIGHFRAYAILVKTAAGRLQVLRLEKRASRPTHAVFHDEAEALAYLANVGAGA
jgi:hypothetical protein